MEAIIIREATELDTQYSDVITQEMAESAKARGTGIAKRSPDYISQKMREGKAVIALTESNQWVGFCYIESWEHEKFVANSGLIVSPTFRKSGVAKKIKQKIFELSRKKFPDAKIFGLTTGLAVMKINSELGYEPVTYSELTTDEEFWKGCRSCVNFDILQSKNRKNCLCTAMLYNPNEKQQETKTTVHTSDEHTQEKPKRSIADNLRLFERWQKFKAFVLLKSGRSEAQKNFAEAEKTKTESKSFFTLLFNL